MDTLELRRKARQLWNDPTMQRKWLRAVLQLGDRWLLHPARPPAKWGVNIVR